MSPQADGVVIGMDPHKRSVTIEVMAADETVLDGGRFGTDRAGYRAMLTCAQRWPNRVWAIEGCQGIGRHVALRLLRDREDVVDVPPKLSARARVFATRHGRKTDATDAHSVALVGTRMAGLRPVVNNEQLAVLRILVDRRRSLGEDHTRMVSQLHQLLLELIPGGAKKNLSAAQAKALLATVRPRDVAGKVRRRVAAELISDLERIYQRKKAANKELKQLVTATGSTLMDLHGIGPSGAARLLVEVGDITRFPTRAHFASWNGTAPIDASSGDQQRHPLSRAGNRQINRTLHIMATVACATAPKDGPTTTGRKQPARPRWKRCAASLVEYRVHGPARGRAVAPRSRRGMASLPSRWTASLSTATFVAPRPGTGVRDMPDRGPNNEEPAQGLDTAESTTDSERRPG